MKNFNQYKRHQNLMKNYSNNQHKSVKHADKITNHIVTESIADGEIYPYSKLLKRLGSYNIQDYIDDSDFVSADLKLEALQEHSTINLDFDIPNNVSLYFAVRRGAGIGIYSIKNLDKFFKAIQFGLDEEKKIHNIDYKVFADLNIATLWMNYADSRNSRMLKTQDRKRLLNKLKHKQDPRTVGAVKYYRAMTNVATSDMKSDLYYALSGKNSLITTDREKAKKEYQSSNYNSLHVYRYEYQAELALAADPLAKSGGWQNKTVKGYSNDYMQSRIHDNADLKTVKLWCKYLKAVSLAVHPAIIWKSLIYSKCRLLDFEDENDAKTIMNAVRKIDPSTSFANTNVFYFFSNIEEAEKYLSEIEADKNLTPMKIESAENEEFAQAAEEYYHDKLISFLISKSDYRLPVHAAGNLSDRAVRGKAEKKPRNHQGLLKIENINTGEIAIKNSENEIDEDAIWFDGSADEKED